MTAWGRGNLASCRQQFTGPSHAEGISGVAAIHGRGSRVFQDRLLVTARKRLLLGPLCIFPIITRHSVGLDSVGSRELHHRLSPGQPGGPGARVVLDEPASFKSGPLPATSIERRSLNEGTYIPIPCVIGFSSPVAPSVAHRPLKWSARYHTEGAFFPLSPAHVGGLALKLWQKSPPKSKKGPQDSANPLNFLGGPSGTRTPNLLIKSQLLYPLS